MDYETLCATFQNVIIAYVAIASLFTLAAIWIATRD